MSVVDVGSSHGRSPSVLLFPRAEAVGLMSSVAGSSRKFPVNKGLSTSPPPVTNPGQPIIVRSGDDHLESEMPPSHFVDLQVRLPAYRISSNS